MFSVISLVWLTPIDPRGWALVAITAAAAALPEGRTASIIRQFVIALVLMAIVLSVLAVAALLFMLSAGGGRIG